MSRLKSMHGSYSKKEGLEVKEFTFTKHSQKVRVIKQL